MWCNATFTAEYLSNLRCHRSDPDLENCIYRNFDKAIPHLVKGVEEIGMPPLNPLELPFMYVNRTVNSLVRIESEMKNVKVVFDEKTTIDAFKWERKKVDRKLWTDAFFLDF